jgi:hypothetical protein
MCSYVTEKTPISGSGKGPKGWFSLTTACVSFDHPYHAPLERTLNIDFLDERSGPGSRLAVELSEESARALLRCIQSALEAG